MFRSSSFPVKMASALVALTFFPPSSFAEGAKNLFYRQIEESNKQLNYSNNIGLTYSVELTRGDKVALVDSRFPFASGDQLRFHVQSNIDGYLYILMKHGTKGNQSLLFPAPGSTEDNKVKAGVDVLVPGDGVLEFDSTPGIETIKLILSKEKLHQDPASYPAAYARSIVVTPKKNAESIAAACLVDMKTKDASKAEFFKSKQSLPNFSAEPAMTFVSKDTTKALAVELDLQHTRGFSSSNPQNSIGRETLSSSTQPKQSSDPKPVWAPSVVADPRVVADKWAIVVGISKFKDPRWDLMYPAKDAEDFASFLIKEGNFAEDHVKVLTNSEATRENILTAMGSKWLPENVKPGDIVVLYFASHGTSAAMDAAHKNFLVAYDTDPQNAFATGIELQDLARTIKRRLNTERIILVLDTCHSGSAQPGAKALVAPAKFSFTDLLQGTGQMVIASASENQIAHDSLRYKNGIFTKHFIDGLRQNKKLADAFAYTQKRVDEESRKDFQQAQMPVIKDGEWKGAAAILSVPPGKPRKVQN